MKTLLNLNYKENQKKKRCGTRTYWHRFCPRKWETTNLSFLNNLYVASCDDPGLLAKGRKIGNDHSHGQIVTYECTAKGSSLVGNHTLTCNDGSWDSGKPECKAPCPDPGRPYQGNRIGIDFRHGKSVTFTCPKDYRVEGERTITCSDGGWSNRKPSCKAPCVKLVPPPHSTISGEGFKHGASVMFYCRYGYTRVGASPIACNNGNWNKPPPVCKGMCPQLRAPYRGGLLRSKDRYLDGDFATFYCDSSHDLFGNDRIRCVGKNWNSSIPVCKARCRFLRIPKGGLYVEGRSEKNGMIKHGEKLTYGCPPAYTMTGSKTRECDNGRWTNDAPVCKAPCPTPGGIAHGRKVGSDYRHEKTVWYQCNAEYTLKGSNRLTCKDGRWNFNPPECKAPCNNPGAPLHGSMQGDDLRHDSRVTFSCDPNYQLDGDKSIRCNDGSWSGSVPNCVAVCPDPGVPSDGKRLNNNFQEGKTVIFECNRDLHLVGNDTIRCEGGRWSGEVPKCRARCAFDGNPVNGYTTDSNFRKDELLPDGSNVKYACDVSYTLVGSDVRHCDNGSWNTSLPSCKASCDDPGFLAKGRKIGNDYSHGQIVTFECTAKGSSLVGNPTLTCNDGSWDSEKPECKSCERPLGLEENKNSIRSPSSLTDRRYPPNAARLNGPSAWCPSRTPAYLQIDLDKSYELTAIATQGGEARNKWVQRYTISFYAGNNILYYTVWIKKGYPGKQGRFVSGRIQI